jgi:hypothetical protein
VKDWKACERHIAELLGGKRVPVSGRARGDAPNTYDENSSFEGVQFNARDYAVDYEQDNSTLQVGAEPAFRGTRAARNE